jgi:tRNA G46 methylase TrmB
MPFFEFLLSRLQPNGTITFASNIPEYIDEAEQQLIKCGSCLMKSKNCTDSARTHFEIKYLERGEFANN